jgi:isochorismate pyruvate lyase
MKINEIRLEIDKIDSEIIKLLSRRSTLISRTAKYKRTASEVRDPKRVDTVIHKVREKAFNTGLDPLIAEKIYRYIIACFITNEMKECKGMYIEYQDV